MLDFNTLPFASPSDRIKKDTVADSILPRDTDFKALKGSTGNFNFVINKTDALRIIQKMLK